MPDEPPSPSPDAARLVALGSDAWAVVLRGARVVMAGEPHVGDPTLARFRDAPTSRLAGGKLRARLATRLASDAALWFAVAEDVARQGQPSAELAALLASADPVAAVEDTGGAVEDPGGGGEHPGGEHPGGGGATRDDRASLALAKRRVREAREEREVWRRRAEGAEARAQRLGAELERAEADLVALRVQLDEAMAALAGAAAERDRAVERERRRRDGEIAAVEQQLAALRRDEEQRRTERRRREEARRQAELDAQRAAADTGRRAHEDRPLRIVPGRPSRLPRGVAPGTTEAARELLHRGRLVLVDGYNVTIQHRGHLDLESQRTWLVQQLGLLARSRGVRPTVIFDGEASGGSRPTAGLRDVAVRFTDAGIIADDEIVLAVEGTDEPVVVVTDDRELAERVAASGADVIATRPFLGAVS